MMRQATTEETREISLELITLAVLPGSRAPLFERKGRNRSSFTKRVNRPARAPSLAARVARMTTELFVIAFPCINTLTGESSMIKESVPMMSI
mmetsp:Transcript_11505/g.27592  ORF Transcript_11505/g.27592 Transcript_11505/m.27592 type:complete len:93 (-) Transcript_11505:1096-1374(-)